MFIRSERLFLRPCWAEDWHDLHRLIADEAVVRNLSRVPWPYTAEDARSFIASPQDPLLPRMLVTRPGPAGEQVLGVIGLSRQDEGEGRKAGDAGKPELGYWIAREHWGHGYASEAARALLSLARALGHRRLAASHFADNPASGRVLAKVGFVATGRKSLRFSRARGASVLAVEHEVALEPAQNGEPEMKPGHRPDEGARRRAA